MLKALDNGCQGWHEVDIGSSAFGLADMVVSIFKEGGVLLSPGYHTALPPWEKLCLGAKK